MTKESINRKKVGKILDAIVTVLIGCVMVVLFWIGIIRPLTAELEIDKLSIKQVKAVLCDAIGGDEKAIKELERLSHRNRVSTYHGLSVVYRYSSARAAGLDFKSDNLDYSKVDFEKSNAIITGAIESADDMVLLSLLRHVEPLFNDDVRAEKLEVANNMKTSTRVKNHAIFSLYTTFSDGEKERLKSCKAKLEDKFSGDLSFLRFNTRGACIEDLEDVGFDTYWKNLVENLQTSSTKSEK